MAQPHAVKKKTIAAPANVNVPMSPLWHLGKVGLAAKSTGTGMVADYMRSESKASLKILQDAIDGLTLKPGAKPRSMTMKRNFWSKFTKRSGGAVATKDIRKPQSSLTTT